MLFGININETRSYVSSKDNKEDNPTIFQLGLIDPFLKAHIERKTTTVEFSGKDPDAPVRGNVNSGEKNILIVKYGVRAIENFGDPMTQKAMDVRMDNVSINGKNYSALPDRILMLLGADLIDELAKQIIPDQSLKKDEIKNS